MYRYRYVDKQVEIFFFITLNVLGDHVHPIYIFWDAFLLSLIVTTGQKKLFP